MRKLILAASAAGILMSVPLATIAKAEDTTVIKKGYPEDSSKTIIKKDEPSSEKKVIIHHDND